MILNIFAPARQRKAGCRWSWPSTNIVPQLSGMGKVLAIRAAASAPAAPARQAESDRRHSGAHYRLQLGWTRSGRSRRVQRDRGRKNSVPVVALVGYTNAGKSTLLNQLTGADIPANNRLFDTLDTTSRQLHGFGQSGRDPVRHGGIYRKLPHHLVDAFRATLEELEYADLLIHVIDSADPHRAEHMAVVDQLIAKPINRGPRSSSATIKADLVPATDIPIGENRVRISAKSGTWAWRNC